jgi:hypothetical protein
VRTRAGLDPGPEIPLPPSGPQLQAPTRIDVDGHSHVGGPGYEPGRPHWFPGGSYHGRHVPGGWYDTPFWPSGVILGGLGGFALGAWPPGRCSATGTATRTATATATPTVTSGASTTSAVAAGDDGGGGWGDSGGGSWGDGGGGWGDSGGGGWGDFGGGGGDFGGGGGD